MEVYKHLCHTARAATLWSVWKFKHKHPLLSDFKKKELFGSERVFSSNMTTQGKEVPYLLTKEEVFTFLDNSLGICRSQVHAGGKSLDFLNDVIKGIKKSLPFTNINLLAGKFPDLTPEDFKYHVLSGQGGTCIWINPFTKVILEQLGHITYHIPGMNHPIIDRPIDKDTHISTIVCDISYPGSRHLVDPGMRYPLYTAVPLDFERESPVYTFHKFKIKFFKTKDDILLLCIPLAPDPDTPVICDSNGESWQLMLEYRLSKQVAWSTFIGKWQEYVKCGSILSKPFDSLLFSTFLTEQLHVNIMCLDGQTHATFYNLKDDTTERVTMKKTELMDFFLEHYPQYSVKKLEKVFEVSKLI